MRLREVSDHRTELMGVAMIFIMASHTIGRFAPFGNIGVEWFLILSGVGLYYSLSKDDNLKRFYNKRFRRIIPTYLLVAIPFFLIQFPFDPCKFLIRISGLNLAFYWERYFWFIPMILICYLIAPFYYRLVHQKRWSIILPFALAVVVYFLSFHMPKTEIMVTRFPIFLLGMHLGKAVFEDKTCFEGKGSCIPVLISAIGMTIVVVINYIPDHLIEVERHVYFICGIPSLIFILYLVKIFERINLIDKLLSLVGKVSLELFLVHPCIVLPLCLRIPCPKIIAVVISYIAAIIVAYALNTAMSYILAWMKR